MVLVGPMGPLTWLASLSGRGNRHTPAAEVPDEFVAIVSVLREDDALRRWFLDLASLPANLRATEVGRISSAMAASGEDASWIKAFNLLVDERVCSSVERILKSET